MFGLFRKKEAASTSSTVSRPLASGGRAAPPVTPRSLQSLFAARFAPLSMRRHRQQFIGALASDKSKDFLASMWKSLAPKLVKQKDVFQPVGLESLVYRKDRYFFAAITFPPPLAITEAYFGILAIGPSAGPEMTSQDLLETAPFRYFVLFRDEATTTKVLDMTDDPYKDLGAGPQPELLLFIEWVNNVLFPEECVVTTVGSSSAMETAISKARSQLTEVLARYDAGEFRGDQFSLKVCVSTDVGSEYLWLDDVEHVEGSVRGIVGDDPRQAKSVKIGERWSGSVADVVDWVLMRGHRLYGNHTLRAMLPDMPPETASMWAKALAEHSDPPPIKR